MAITLSGDFVADGASIEFLTHRLDHEQRHNPDAAANDRTYAMLVALIEKEDYAAALKLTERPSSDRIKNLRAAALMRSGRPDEAVSLLRGIVVESNSLELKPNVPRQIVANFATALLMSGKVAGCVKTINECSELADSVFLEAIQRNIRAWENSLSWWQWLDWKLTGVEHIDGTIAFDFLPGDLDLI